MNVKPDYITLTIAALFLGLGAPPKVRAVSTLSLSPAIETAAADSDFAIQLTITVDTQSAFGADAVLTYNPNDIEVISAASGGFFSDFTSAQHAAAGRAGGRRC